MGPDKVSELVSEPQTERETVMTFKAVTTAQLEQVRKMANDKSVGKDDFQQGLDRGTVAAMLDSLKSVKPEVSIPLLTKVGIVEVSAVAKFVAADHFNSGDDIKFYLGSNFSNNFLGKIKEDVKSAIIAIHRLEKASRDDRIMAELGINIKSKKGVIKLAHFREMLKVQAKGKEGPLLVNGYANIAYIEDEKGTLWAVDACWLSINREWLVNAGSIGHPCGWGVGDQVLSQVS